MAHFAVVTLFSFNFIVYSKVDAYTFSDQYGTCDETFHIGKNTVATTDSYREYSNAYNIFPYIRDQNAYKFVDGMCGTQMKLELPDTCFQIHSPVTNQHDEGLLSVKILENKFTKKWKYVMSQKYGYHYDSFIDFNMGFWVDKLDPYIQRWSDFNFNIDLELDEQSKLLKFEYFGIKWKYNLDNDLKIKSNDYIDNQFYSLIIHSPSSAIIYEFISYSKPSNKFYNQINWIQSNMERVTFMAMSNNYPWNRHDQAVIVPVRISRATTNLAATKDFYINIMDSDTLYYSNNAIIDDLGGDNVETKYGFFVLPHTQIELLFVERASVYTGGEFTLKQYEDLLKETHDSIISTPFCGLDRWCDNHYGYSSWTSDGYFDEIVKRLQQRGLKYRLYKTLNEDTTGKETMSYTMFLFEPSGQTIQMSGYFENEKMKNKVPYWNSQWCYRVCNGQQIEGKIDKTHVYIDNENYKDLERLFYFGDLISKPGHSIYLYLIIIIPILLCVFCISGLIYYCIVHKKETSKHDDGRLPILKNEYTPILW